VTHTILIVDDSPTATPELRALLEAEDYHVTTALRGEEALDTLRLSQVDLVITEALLPGMDGFELVRQIRANEAWTLIPIIMLTVRSAPEDYAASFDAGADEFFVKPAEAPKISAVTRGLLTRYDRARRSDMPPGQRSHRVAAAGAMPVRTERGKIIAVFSLKGGVGTTTIAVNLAVAIKRLEPTARVGLIDLSLEEGLDAMLLDIVPTSTIVEWSREDLSEATPYLLNQYFVQHRTGVSLLAAPAHAEQAEMVRPEIVRKTLGLAPDAFDYIILDTMSSFTEGTLIALEMADTVVLPVMADMAALKAAANTMRIFKAVKIPEDRVRVILNELIPRAGLTRQQVEASLGQSVHNLPYAGSGFIDALNAGTPLVAAEPPVPAARSLLEFARSLCEPEESQVVETKSTRANLLGKLRRA